MGRLEGVQKGWVDLSCVTERPLLQRLARIPGRRDREAPASIHLSAWGLRTWLSATLLRTDVVASVALGEVGVGELKPRPDLEGRQRLAQEASRVCPLLAMFASLPLLCL